MDVNSFNQMLVNLLENAVKYSPVGEDIDITLSSAEGEVTVTVEDRGPGIPEVERERIWEPYYRSLNDQNKSVGGTGIGLSVVGELVRLHGGRVGVTDREGGGSRFAIDLPVCGATA